MEKHKINMEIRERKIAGWKRIKEAYEAAKQAGTIKTYRIQEIKGEIVTNSVT